ncbi:MAG TPA: signal peptide peptidase SppA [Rubrobacteraceae bacterium]|nr:signal peptide peptidase SppA [Rubrobacteraceae bacterium]
MSQENGPARDLTNETPQGAPSNRRRRWPWVVGGVAALGLLALIAGAVGLALALGGGGYSSPPTYEEEYVSGDGSDRIAVVPVEGEISSADSTLGGTQPVTTPEGLEDALRQAGDDDSVAAVILEVNSPGGGVTASDEMHQAILDFKEKTDKPVIVSMDDVAASGGYYISTAADEIVANRTTLTGSLGVILQLNDFSEAADKYGIKQQVIKSGKYKDIGNAFRKIKPEEREILQKIVDENYDQFVSVIVKGRGLPEKKVREIADGRIYSGIQAKKLGLVDEFGGLDEAAKVARKMANIDKATVVRYTQPPSLTDTLLATFGPQKPEAVQVMEAAGIDLTPEIKYLYRPGL